MSDMSSESSCFPLASEKDKISVNLTLDFSIFNFTF